MPGAEDKNKKNKTSIFTTIKSTVSTRVTQPTTTQRPADLSTKFVISPASAVPLGTSETFKHSTAAAFNTNTK